MAKNENLFNAIGKGDRDGAKEVIEAELEKGTEPTELLMDSMIPAMREIGERFARHEVYVPQMLIAARAMQAGLDIIEPLMVDSGHEPEGKVCIGTTKGDLHDIGKNLVAMMVKGNGYEVIDLGTDCDIQKYQEGVDQGAQAVLMSALLTTTMPYMKTVVDHFRDNENVKTMIGGAPVTQKYADEIGADAYASNPSEATKVLATLIGK